MFSKRHDGRQIKSIDPIFRIIPHIMDRRTDSQVFYRQRVYCDILDSYIREHRDECPGLNYMSIIIAALVRLLSQRPFLNRFVSNGRLFARKGVSVSFNIKRVLKDDVVETAVKLHFTGKEDLAQINRAVVQAVEESCRPAAQTGADKLAAAFAAMPNFLVHIVVGIAKWLDRVGMLPRFIAEESPFHCSFYLTNVKSLKLNYVYHHLYNFGTASLFFSMGNSEKVVTFDREGLHQRKSMVLGITIDERICDGLYLANSLKLLKTLLKNPELLAVPPETLPADIP